MFGLQFLSGIGQTLGGINADRRLTTDDLQFSVQPLNTTATVLDFSGHRMQADRHSGAGGIEQTHRLIGQLPSRNVAMRQLDRCLQRLIKNLHPMMLFHGRGHATHHQNGFVFARFAHLHHLKTAGQRGVFFDVLLVLGPSRSGDGAQFAACQRRFEQISGITRTRRATSTNQGVRFVDEQNDRLG